MQLGPLSSGVGRPGVLTPAVRQVVLMAHYTPEARALFARMTTAPSDARKDDIDALIRALKSAGVWTKLDYFYCLAAADAQAASLNWLGNSLTLTPTNSPTFTADQGYTGNGTSSYLDTGFNATTATNPKTVQNSNHLGLYCLNSVTSNAAMGTATRSLQPRVGGGLDNFAVRAGNATAVVVGNTITSIGHFVGTRADATQVSGYIDGVLLGTVASASTALSNATDWILARSPGNYGTYQIAFAHGGAALTGGDVAAINAAILAYLS